MWLIRTFGNRSDSKYLLENLNKFFTNVFFPYIDEYDIKHVINLGDTVDRRKFINFNTSQQLTNILMEPLYKRGIESHFLLGNHDVTYKSTNSVNAIRELYGASKYMDFMKLYEEPAYTTVAGLPMLMLPWINMENEKLSYQLINENKVSVAMGHLDIIGFKMYRMSVSEHGLDKDIFERYSLVCSGHYHHKNSNGPIHYLGSVGQYTWADYGDARGFHILDTETLLMDFIPNPYYLFNKITYDDSTKSEDFYQNLPITQYKDTYVKVVVKNKNNPYCLEKFIERLENIGCISVQIIEDKLSLDIETNEDELTENEDTLTILTKYIESMNLESKSELEKFMHGLYFKALEVE